MSFSESICKESEDVDVDVDVDVPPHVQELVATDNSRFEDWVMQVKAFRVRWFGSSDMVTGNHGNHSPLESISISMFSVLPKLTVLVMCDQDGVLIGHKSFKRKKLFAALNSRDTFRL